MLRERNERARSFSDDRQGDTLRETARTRSARAIERRKERREAHLRLEAELCELVERNDPKHAKLGRSNLDDLGCGQHEARILVGKVDVGDVNVRRVFAEMEKRGAC
jgi:hypothetical protein